MHILRSLYAACAVLIFMFMVLFSRKIVLLNADLGRHLVTGSVLIEQITAGASLESLWEHPVLHTNYYSYTQPDFPVSNHHWLFGLLARLVAGDSDSLVGLSIVNTLLCLAAYLVAVAIGVRQKTPSWLVLLVGILALPLFTHRVEVRPESVSLFLTALYTGVLFFTSKQEKLLGQVVSVAVLVLLQVFWANVHLFFILGPALAGAFLLRALAAGKQRVYFAVLVVLLVLASAITPHGWETLLVPITILHDYGYPIAENQSTWFMFSTGFHREYYAYVSILTLFVVGIVAFSFRLRPPKRWITSWRLFFVALATVFAVLTHVVNRMSPLLGIFLMIVLLQHGTVIWQHWGDRVAKILRNSVTLSVVSGVACLWLILWARAGALPTSPEVIGFGAYPDLETSAQFALDRQLSGPIFNNYDSGGYLLYYLYPQHSIFIDNRPEAYETAFIKDVYIAAQQDEVVWQQLLDEYKFQTIYFYALDMTDWARPFLAKRLQDPEWEVAYYDQLSIILTRTAPELLPE